MMTTTVQFNAALLQKYDQPLPRDTSYPSATEFRVDLHDTDAQNDHSLTDYYRVLDAGQLPIGKAIQLSQEDILRRQIVSQLMCHFSLAKTDIERQYQLNFDT